MEMANRGHSQGNLGQLPAWAASPSEATGDTIGNFDNGTYRSVAAFTWELGPRSGEPCGAGCGEGETCCWVLGSEQCIDTSSCGLNCGGCGHACELGEVCANGACVPWYDHVDPCPLGLTNCGREGEIECVDLEGDVLHCGSCANQCSPEADCVDGVCVFPQGHHEVIYE
jgi:hypothetical protein